MGIVDYWANAFTPDRRALWDAAIAAQGIPLKVRRDETDSLADAATMVARMDELAIDTLLLPAADAPGDTQVGASRVTLVGVQGRGMSAPSSALSHRAFMPFFQYCKASNCPLTTRYLASLLAA